MKRRLRKCFFCLLTMIKNRRVFKQTHADTLMLAPFLLFLYIKGVKRIEARRAGEAVSSTGKGKIKISINATDNEEIQPGLQIVSLEVRADVCFLFRSFYLHRDKLGLWVNDNLFSFPDVYAGREGLGWQRTTAEVVPYRRLTLHCPFSILR